MFFYENDAIWCLFSAYKNFTNPTVRTFIHAPTPSGSISGCDVLLCRCSTEAINNSSTCVLKLAAHWVLIQR